MCRRKNIGQVQKSWRNLEEARRDEKTWAERGLSLVTFALMASKVCKCPAAPEAGGSIILLITAVSSCTGLHSARAGAMIWDCFWGESFCATLNRRGYIVRRGGSNIFFAPSSKCFAAPPIESLISVYQGFAFSDRAWNPQDLASL